MRFLRPLEIRPGGYTSTAPIDRTAPLWAATTSVTAVGGGSAGLPSFALLTYQVGDQVTFGGSVYQCIAVNTGHPPPQWPLEWAVLGAANDYAMFDSVGGTSTFGAGSLTVSAQIHTRRIDAVALVGVLATSVSLTVGGQTRTANPAGGYAETILFEGLSGATGSAATLTITGGDLAIKAMLLGNMYTLGETIYGAGVEFVDYSRKDTDAFGNETLIKRAYSRRLNAPVKVPNLITDEASRAVESVRATPTYWACSGQYESLKIYGYVKDFRKLISYPTISDFTLTIEGMSGGDSPASIGAGAVTSSVPGPAPPAPVPTPPPAPGYTVSPVLSHLRFDVQPLVDQVAQNQVLYAQNGAIVPASQSTLFTATGAGQGGVSGSGGALSLGEATYQNRVFAVGTYYGQTQSPVFTLNEVGLTFEAFFYVSAGADNFFPWIMYGARDLGGGDSIYTRLELHFHAGVVDIYVQDSTNIGYSGAVTAPTLSNGWTHIAVVASAVGTNAYVSGVKVMSGSYAADTAPPPAFIGYEMDDYEFFGNPFDGRLPLVGEVWVDEMRLTNGVVYSGDSFTPPSGPLPAYVNTYAPRVLTNLPANTTLADLSFSAYPPTDAAGRATMLSAVALAGAPPLAAGRAGGALSLVGDQLVRLDSTPTDRAHVQRIGTNSVTVEFAMKLSTSAAAELNSGSATRSVGFVRVVFINPDLATSTDLSIGVRLGDTTKTLQLSAQASISGRNISGPTPTAGAMLPPDFAAADSWVHCAVVVTGNTLSVYLRGLLVANTAVVSSGSAVTLIPETLEMRQLVLVGGDPAADRAGVLVDEFRITNSAKYNGAQYVPAASTVNADVFDTPGKPYQTSAYLGFDTTPMRETLSRANLSTFVAGTVLTPVNPQVAGRSGFALDLYDLRASGNGVFSQAANYPVAPTLDGYVIEADLRQITPETYFNVRGYWDSNTADAGSTYMNLTLYTSFNAGTRFLSVGIFVSDGSAGRFADINAFFGLPPSLPLGQWARCAVQLTGNQLKLFLNGALVGSQPLAYNVGGLRLPYVQTDIYGTAPGATAGQNLIDNVRVAHGVLYP